MTRVRWVRHRRAGALAASVILIVSGGVPALAASATTYRGRSSQGLPVSIVVAGSTIQRLTIDWSARCPALRAPLRGITTYHTDVALVHDAWNAAGTYGAHVAGGYLEEFSVRDHGTVSGSRRATGVFAGTVRIYRGAKRKHIDTCQSGNVTFTLPRAR